jgi:V8-like Glu-specific endopeptidase
MHMRPFLFSAVLSASFALGLGCGSPSVPLEESPDVQTLPIVNGEEESGYPGVGTLVQNIVGLRASFCTGTLIAPNWVVTAAHCLKDQPTELVAFYVGKDGNGFGGTVYPAAELIYHPRYTAETNPGAVLYDIGLVKLKTPVPATAAKPYPYNRDGLKKGSKVTFIGYGATGAPMQMPVGAGTKRRTAVNIDRVDDLTYSLKFEGTGVCFGDSGGPGLSDFEGETRVISVVSTGNGCAGAECDPCNEAGSNHTRVDTFSDWIASHIGDEFPHCNDDLSVCECPQACGVDGVCDNAACKGKSCGEVLNCVLEDCNNGEDGSCNQACMHAASPEALNRIASLFTCWAAECEGKSGAEADACTDSSCTAERSVCEEKAGPNLCSAVDACVLDCKDDKCKKACLLGGTIEAQTNQPSLETCRSKECKGKTGAELTACAQANCSAAFDVCYPPDHCSPLGGACNEGESCAPVRDKITRCTPSGGKGEGQACDPEAAAPDCEDGLHCRESGKSGVCVPACKTDDDCAKKCDVGEYPGDPSLGLCKPKPKPGGTCSVHPSSNGASPWPLIMLGMSALWTLRRRSAR